MCVELELSDYVDLSTSLSGIAPNKRQAQLRPLTHDLDNKNLYCLS